MQVTDTRISRSPEPGELHVQVRSPSVRDASKLPACVFVHGFLGDGVENHRMFMRIADALGQLGLTSVLVDQYGCGYSDGSYEDVRLSTMRVDLASTIRWTRREISQKYCLIGQSVGSSLCLEWMSTAQDPFCQFCVAFNPVGWFDKWLLDRYGWTLSSSRDLYCAEHKGIYVAREFVSDLLAWNWLDRLEGSNLPVLFISSESDDTGSPLIVKEASGKLGAMSRIVAIAGANHSFACQRSLEGYAADAVKDWVAALLTR